ncbi:hypothetical protein ACJX0J_039477, partial [Zea mays]
MHITSVIECPPFMSILYFMFFAKTHAYCIGCHVMEVESNGLLTLIIYYVMHEEPSLDYNGQHFDSLASSGMHGIENYTSKLILLIISIEPTFPLVPIQNNKKELIFKEEEEEINKQV